MTNMSEENIGTMVGQITDEMSHEQRLFHHAIASMNEEASFMQFWLLQKTNLIEIQNDIARLRGQIFEKREVSSQTAKDLRVLLHEYGQSIRSLLLLESPQ